MQVGEKRNMRVHSGAADIVAVGEVLGQVLFLFRIMIAQIDHETDGFLGDDGEDVSRFALINFVDLLGRNTIGGQIFRGPVRGLEIITQVLFHAFNQRLRGFAPVLIPGQAG